MRFVDLEPTFVKHSGGGDYESVDNIVSAEGVMFLCPTCVRDKGGPEAEGVHSILCWHPVVPREIPPSPGRWSLVGRDLRDVSLVGTRTSSICLQGHCHAHFFVENGEVRFA